MQTNAILLESIALRKTVQATYNRTRMQLAPHILYTRHGDLFMDAVPLERDGQPAKEVKLGTFKIAGLTEVALAGKPFKPDAIFDPAAEKYADNTLFAVEAD